MQAETTPRRVSRISGIARRVRTSFGGGLDSPAVYRAEVVLVDPRSESSAGYDIEITLLAVENSSTRIEMSMWNRTAVYTPEMERRFDELYDSVLQLAPTTPLADVESPLD